MIGNLNSQLKIPETPKEIFWLAVNNFDSNNFYMRLGSGLEEIISGINLEMLQLNSQPRILSMVLALITFFQYYERLTDRTALESIHYRTEWKFALHLPVKDFEMRETILCEYRRFLLKDDNRLKVYSTLIRQLTDLLPKKENRYQHVSAKQLIQEVCEYNQKYTAVSLINTALTILKINHPKWLKQHDKPRLYARYLPTTSQFDLLIPHDVSQFQLNDVLDDIDFLIQEVNRSGSEEVSNLIEINTLSQFASQIRRIKAGKHTASDCDKFIAMLNKHEVNRG
jgi:hypothetical protein